MNTSYAHTQFGTVMVASLLGAAILVAAAAFKTGCTLVTGLVELVVLGCAWLFCCLIVEIAGNELVCRFGPGLIKKRFVLSEIRDAKAVKNPWYYGWGIRLTPSWMALQCLGPRCCRDRTGFRQNVPDWDRPPRRACRSYTKGQQQLMGYMDCYEQGGIP